MRAELNANASKMVEIPFQITFIRDCTWSGVTYVNDEETLDTQTVVV